ncbi:hypothetical protein H9Q74_014263 [Fusarium xylarioides]|nr:hypothetical protein H9Q74_014263 [Fusarium xylarioides]
MRTIGCKAFALTDSAQRKDKRLQSRTMPKAWIGFLVGYNSQNIFRIWNPVTNKIYITRDVIFNEDEFFNADEVQMKETIGEQTLEEIQARMHSLMTSEGLDQVMDPVQGPDEQENADSTLENLIEDLPTEEADPTEERESDDAKYTQVRFELLPTPPESPYSSFLAQIGVQLSVNAEGLKEDLLVFNQAFNAGTMASPIAKHKGKLVTKATRSRYIRGRLKPRCEAPRARTNLIPDREEFHRRNLPQAPSSHGSLSGHRFEEKFRQAQRDHLESHKQMGSWLEISKLDSRIGGSQVLDCMWVFTYKFDKHGYLQKCKARLVVRGDQQYKSSTDDTYAATLAGKSFRTLIAIAAKYDLELLQYDAVNAFVNARLQTNIFMRLPPGYKSGDKADRVLLLHKALYGLRIAPLLWQTELGNTLESQGWKSIPNEPCCYQKEGILMFFYVDDIVFAFKKRDEKTALQQIQSLQKKYKMTGGNDLQWFLGMEIIRDRETKRIWVTQTSYLEKICDQSTAKTRNESPMSKEELLPNEEKATLQAINWYRRAIGSLLYASVITRPDIAFAVSRLARFMTNPSEEHIHAVNRVFNYLKATRFYGLEFGPGEGFEVHSDASFADNSIDRKSSQGYTMSLFGSLIGWRANKQDTVTTSTTEAELLALSQAAKEGLFQQRLLQGLHFELPKKELQLSCHSKLQSTDLQLYCDNKQTISLLKNSLQKLKTKLKHVDVHNHWLREQLQKKTIFLEYKQSSDLIADGLTKALQGQSQKKSCRQFGLVNIEDRISRRRDETVPERSMEEILEELQL